MEDASPLSGPSANIDRQPPNGALDPLSQHILKRTHLPLPPNRTYSQPVSVDGSSLHEQQATYTTGDSVMGILKDKSKGVRILNRFISHKKKETPEDNSYPVQEAVEHRPEGADVEIYHEPIDNIEYNPQHPQVPPYIRMRSHAKKEKEFNRLFLAQELHFNTKPSHPRNNSDDSSTWKREKPTDNAIWAMEFSCDGKYLAAAGQDNVVRIWAVLVSRDDRRTAEKEQESIRNTNEGRVRLSAPVFREEPYRVLQGHDKAVMDLSWSKNNFLLSSSMDKTVRLWHMSRNDCLCAFKHTDIVTSIQFHPRDDRFFLAGSLDFKIRLWSIPDKSVVFWNKSTEMITAVAFTPDGKTSIAGCISGLCLFYDTEGMKYQTQIQVKSAHGKNSKGSKITGIQTTNIPAHDPNGAVKFIVTTNDSRIRWYNMRDKALEMKFKGNQNASGQIHARLSDDASYIICGSEDKKVFIWSAGLINSEHRDKNPLEFFEAHSTSTSVAVIAPTTTRRLLSNSEDPVYDTCNPPAVLLVSKDEAGSVHSSRTPTEDGSILPTPATAEGGGTFKKPEASASYLARSAHPDGNIIITASQGAIKVFRQDCAWDKWRTDSCDASSIFSKRPSSRAGVVRRQASQLTQSSGRSRTNSNATQPGRDRILTWRQSMGSTTSVDRTWQQVPTLTKDRSHSPQKASSPLVARYYNGASKAPTVAGASETNSFVTAPSDDSPTRAPETQQPEIHLERMDSNTYFQRAAFRDGLNQQMHNTGRIEVERKKRSNSNQLDVPNLSRRISAASTLSDEGSSSAVSSAEEKEKVEDTRVKGVKGWF